MAASESVAADSFRTERKRRHEPTSATDRRTEFGGGTTRDDEAGWMAGWPALVSSKDKPRLAWPKWACLGGMCIVGGGSASHGT